ncbi:hypothetical protein FN846DRAFT_892479 [Sphaerosporella brunnea]|uniref:Uncharacterized protein n=1 Tax=Sphaerosporella brunnea TaxID=1250544 RepID=A0A5J5EPF7_9PEZI|nr:hypothetical protein FN846DRAFT_892479 [Sphaerosporella brunnea]
MPDDILYSPPVPTNPKEAQDLFEAALANLEGSKSPRSQRSATYLRKLRDFGIKAHGDTTMAIAGERHLFEQLAFKQKKKTDERQLKNDEVGRAFLVERGSTLRKAREDRDQKAAQAAVDKAEKEKIKMEAAAKREVKKRQKETAQNARSTKKQKSVAPALATE